MELCDLLAATKAVFYVVRMIHRSVTNLHIAVMINERCGSVVDCARHVLLVCTSVVLLCLKLTEGGLLESVGPKYRLIKRRKTNAFRTKLKNKPAMLDSEPKLGGGGN